MVSLLATIAQVTSRAKRAALLKLFALKSELQLPEESHQPRETRGPIETKAERKVSYDVLSTSPAARNARPY